MGTHNKLQDDMNPFELSMKRMINTPDGLVFLATLKDRYVDTSSIRDTPEQTYYHLSMKEFTLFMMEYVENGVVLKDHLAADEDVTVVSDIG